MRYKPKRRRLTLEERRIVHAKCGGHCAYCGTLIEFKRMQVDHVESIEMGGVDTIDNMLPSCRSCNHYKSSSPLYSFRRAIEAWPDVLMRDSITYRNAVRFGMVEPKPHAVVFYFEKEEEHTCNNAHVAENC